jgi:hypothetical protein
MGEWGQLDTLRRLICPIRPRGKYGLRRVLGVSAGHRVPPRELDGRRIARRTAKDVNAAKRGDELIAVQS